jgi:hypothetical protein
VWVWRDLEIRGGQADLRNHIGAAGKVGEQIEELHLEGEGGGESTGEGEETMVYASGFHPQS